MPKSCYAKMPHPAIDGRCDNLPHVIFQYRRSVTLLGCGILSWLPVADPATVDIESAAMSDTVKVIGATSHLRTVPGTGLMGHLFVPVGADGTPLQVERDQAGQTVRVKGVSKSGVNQMDFSGAWPNEDITFSTDGVPYLYVWSSLQQLPEFAVGWNFLFTLGYRSADAELIYEVVLPMNGVLLAAGIAAVWRHSRGPVFISRLGPLPMARGGVLRSRRRFLWLGRLRGGRARRRAR
jgi:hypothetical protein